MEGKEIDDLLTSLSLFRVISEPTHSEPSKNPTCIDQPNLIIDSKMRASLDPYCHHHIIYCTVKFRIPSSQLGRAIWHFYTANITAIQRSMIPTGNLKYPIFS